MVFPSLPPDGVSQNVAVDLHAITSLAADWAEPLYWMELRAEHLGDRGVGGYAGAVMVHGFDDAGLGNVEVGGLYQHVRGRYVLTGRLGVALPTASDNDAVLEAALIADPMDLVLGLPDTTSLRGGATLRWTDGRVFARWDLSVDVPVSAPDDAMLDRPVVVFGGALGLLRGLRDAVSLEVSNGIVLLDGVDSRLMRVGLTVQRTSADGVTIYAGIAKPSAKNTIELGFDSDWAFDFSAGVRGRL